MKAHKEYEPRREEACAVCAVKDWLENRHQVYLFQEATGATTWRHRYFHAADDEEMDADEDGEGHRACDNAKPAARGNLLVQDDGTFCFGPKQPR